MTTQLDEKLDRFFRGPDPVRNKLISAAISEVMAIHEIKGLDDDDKEKIIALLIQRIACRTELSRSAASPDNNPYFSNTDNMKRLDTDNTETLSGFLGWCFLFNGIADETAPRRVTSQIESIVSDLALQKPPIEGECVAVKDVPALPNPSDAKHMGRLANAGVKQGRPRNQ